jgi:hypothetical protein
MIKYCPIMSFQKEYNSEERCMEEICALWDEERNQCCFKTQALVVTAKPSGGFNPPASEFAVFPPPTTLNGSGDYTNPHPYTITCDANGVTIQ